MKYWQAMSYYHRPMTIREALYPERPMCLTCPKTGLLIVKEPISSFSRLRVRA